MLNVGGLQYHLNCAGQGNPTVILESGLGDNSLVWYSVQKELAEFTKVCSYDRAGLGWSEGPDGLLSTNRISNDLDKLLKEGKVQLPYILVGHSRGGIYVRNFFKSHMKSVVGMVLVDSTHEQGIERISKLARIGFLKQLISIQLAPILSRLGLIRLFGIANAESRGDKLPNDILEIKTALQNLNKTTDAVRNELLVLREGLDRAQEAPPSLEDIPLVVISSGKRIPKEFRNEPRDGKEEKARGYIEYEMQKELSELSTRGKLQFAESSGHFIMYDEPDIIIKSILEQVEAQKINGFE